MTNETLAAARSAASAWHGEAERRRAISAPDAVADAMDFCATDLLEKLRLFDAPGAVQTVQEYADEHGVTAQSVRKWITRKRIDATRTPHGWRILRTAVVRPSIRRAK